MRLRLSLLAVVAALAACAHRTAELRMIERLADSGQWFAAREAATQTLKARPGRADVAARITALDRLAREQEENLEFDPRKYFYAQAYLDYFERRLFQRAVENMEQVLVFGLENAEILRFMDSAQIKAEAEREKTQRQIDALLERAAAHFRSGDLQEARRAADLVATLDASNAQAQQWQSKIRRAIVASAPAPARAAPPPRPAPDPAWVEARYHEAVKSYVRGDLAKARETLSEVVDRDPANDRCKRMLMRIEKELAR